MNKSNMTEQDELDAAGWDPDEARERISAKKMKMPVCMIRTNTDEVEQDAEFSEPKEKAPAPPVKIVSIKKNKSSLF